MGVAWQMWGMPDARLGCEERGTVQLYELRGANSEGSSVAADAADGARLSRNPRKNFLLSVNYLTLLDRFLNDAA